MRTPAADDDEEDLDDGFGGDIHIEIHKYISVKTPFAN